MTPDTCCPLTLSIGALLLGALDPIDRQDLQVHLDDCQECRSELVLLAQLPGFLHRLSVEDGLGLRCSGAAPLPEAGAELHGDGRDITNGGPPTDAGSQTETG